MSLTTAQKATLKEYILADVELSALIALDNFPAIALKLADVATPDFRVWRTTTPVADIQDAITWANFTPANPGVGTDQVTNGNILNWFMSCQSKQFNLQLLLASRDSISTSKQNIRAGLEDCLTGIPSGANGNTRGGGWSNVQLVIQRPANRLEKLFAIGAGTSAAPATLVVEGMVNNEVIQLLFLG